MTCDWPFMLSLLLPVHLKFIVKSLIKIIIIMLFTLLTSSTVLEALNLDKLLSHYSDLL